MYFPPHDHSAAQQDDVGAQLVGFGNGIAPAFQAMAMPSRVEDVQGRAQLPYKPCLDSCTVSEVLEKYITFKGTYPTFEHIKDYIKEQLDNEKYKLNRNQGLFQIAVSVILGFVIVVTYTIAIYKISNDTLRDKIETVDHIGNFIFPLSPLAGFVLTLGLACFGLYSLFQDKKIAIQKLIKSKEPYDNSRSQLVTPYRLSWAFFALIELLNEIETPPINDTPELRMRIDTVLNKIKKTLHSFPKLSSIISKNNCHESLVVIINDIYDVLVSSEIAQSSQRLTNSYFKGSWIQILTAIRTMYDGLILKNNLRSEPNRLIYNMNFMTQISTDINFQKQLIRIIGIIAKNNKHNPVYDLLKPMNLGQRFVPPYIQAALDKHRAHPDVVQKIGDPAIVDNKVLTRLIFIHLSSLDPTSPFRNILTIAPTPRMEQYYPEPEFATTFDEDQAQQQSTPAATQTRCSGDLCTLYQTDHRRSRSAGHLSHIRPGIMP